MFGDCRSRRPSRRQWDLLAAPAPPKEERGGAASTTSASPVTASEEAADLAAGDPHGAADLGRVDRPVGYSAADTRWGECERRCDLSNTERLWLPNGGRHRQTIPLASAYVVFDNEKVYSSLGEERVSHRVRVVESVPHVRPQRTPPAATTSSSSTSRAGADTQHALRPADATSG